MESALLKSIPASGFEVIGKDPGSKARCGILKTCHGIIQTPVFMPVGTHGVVKTLSTRELEELGAEVLLCNAYHLFLRPGIDVIEKAGGIHGFLDWNRPVLTDSGGFQIFSLEEIQGIQGVSPEGITFKSHIDGRSCFLTPEAVLDIQKGLASDIWMPLDYCLSYPADTTQVKEAVRLTQLWARRSKAHWTEFPESQRGLLFGIIQGGTIPQCRRESLEGILSLNVQGLAIGGLSVGEPQDLRIEILSDLVPGMPEEMPRYFMGVGYPEDIVLAVEQGIDCFDCVAPTRNGRNGTVFFSGGKLLLGSQKYREDFRPIDEACACWTCRHTTRAYLRHLFKCKEMLGLRLASLHNLFYFIKLLERMRDAIAQRKFSEFKKNFFSNLGRGSAE